MKKAFGFIFLVCTTMLLMGCLTIFNHDISEVEDILKSLNESTDIDMDYTLNVSSSSVSMSMNSKVVVKAYEDGQRVFMKVSDGTEEIEMYYVDQYLCTIMGNDYSVSEGLSFEMETENPIPTDFDFTKIQYKLHTQELLSKIIYTVKIEDSGIKALVEEIVGSEIPDMNISMEFEITVDKKTNKLEKLEYLITMSKDEEIVNVEMLVTINALGDEVDLVVPTKVTQKINEYINGGNIDPDPDPDPVIYENTADGVVEYFNLGLFEKVLYDEKTSKLIVLRNNRIDIYNANTMTLENTITSLLTPVCADVDGGKLVVGYNANQFSLYNLSQNLEPITYQTNIKVSEIVIDGSTVIYADDNQWCDLVFHNIETNDKIKKGSVYQPLLTLNRKDHILYVTETGLSSSELIYYNSQSGTQLYASQFSQFVYVKDRILFDGKYIHHEGKSFNRFNGTVVSSNFLNRMYPSFVGFTPKVTLYDSDNLAFVGGASNNVGIYDNNNNNFVYKFTLDSSYVIEMADGKYLTVSGDNKYVAVVDVKLIDEDLINDNINETPGDTVVTSLDKKLNTLKTTIYTKSVNDEKFIYTLNENSYVLNVYDIKTLEKVYTEKFMIKPISIDAGFNKLVIGFGNAHQFRIYNNSTWEYETVVTSEPVFSSVIYKDRIIYSDIDQHCYIQSYDIVKKTHSYLGYSGYFVSMAINREKGIVYFGDTKSSGSDLTYFNLETNKVIYTEEFYYGKTLVTFDGNFVHYEKATFDALTGLRISNTGQARQYKNVDEYTYKTTIFDDNTISVFTAVKADEYVTVVYELTTDRILYIYKGRGTNAYKIDNTLVVLENLSEYIRSIKLN